MDKLGQLIESAAEQAVLLDTSDLPGMAAFSKLLREIATACESAPLADSSKNITIEASNKTADLVEKVILDESADPGADMNIVRGAVSALQAVANGRGLREAGFPAELNLSLQGDEDRRPDARSGRLSQDQDGGRGAPRRDSPRADTGDKDVAASVTIPTTVAENGIVDEALFKEYLEVQQTALVDMEQMILAFEKENSAESLAGLRRVLHTMKGEAGVVGANDIESFCHAAEEYIDGSDISTDVLFEIRDWLDGAVKTYLKGGKPEAPPAISGGGKRQTPESGADESIQARGIGDESITAGHPEAVSIGDRELAGEFVNESHEHFDSADNNLLILEKDPGNAEAISAVFRAVHTVKGIVGFLGLKPLGDLAHEAETLMDEVRKGQRKFEGDVVDVIFSSIDMLKIMTSDLKEALASGTDMAIRPEFSGLLKSLKAVLAKDSGADSSSKQPASVIETVSEPVVETDVPPEEGTKADRSISSAKAVEVSHTMKVDAARIDLLLDTIGELVIAESIVAGDPDVKALKSLRLERNLAHLSKITRSLQDQGMSMRLVPVDATFRKMARLVRDLSRKSGKNAELVIEGGDTEIDKGMVEKLADPLVHMIRNSMDHGIETEKERRASGKPPCAKIVLRAFHKGGNVHIEIEDDGKGLDRDAIIARAIERGLIATGDGLSDQDVFALIFAAGFSTAKKVTEISGRGVGMDVVRRNIEELRGNVLIRSTEGKGSVFTIILPLTMAIIDGMLIRVGKDIYVIPTLSIIESFRPAANMISTITGKGEMVGFRGALLVLLRLSDVLAIPDGTKNPTEAIVIVVEEAGKQWGFLADEILGQQQIVIKTLGEAMGNIQGVSGACIMADGRPGLILDVGGVIKMATIARH